MRVYWIAVCRDCPAPLPMPFDDADGRDGWAQRHRVAKGHRVETSFVLEVSANERTAFLDAASARVQACGRRAGAGSG